MQEAAPAADAASDRTIAANAAATQSLYGQDRERVMHERVLGTLTIGQAPRADVVPIIDRHIRPEVRRIHRGVLDGLSRAEIGARYRPEPGEAELVTRLKDGSEISLSRRRMRDGVQ